MQLPDNVEFPWNDMISLTKDDNRGIGLSLYAVHEQLCVVADLLRVRIQQEDEYAEMFKQREAKRQANQQKFYLKGNG